MVSEVIQRRKKRWAGSEISGGMRSDGMGVQAEKGGGRQECGQERRRAGIVTVDRHMKSPPRMKVQNPDEGRCDEQVKITPVRLETQLGSSEKSPGLKKPIKQVIP